MTYKDSGVLLDSVTTTKTWGLDNTCQRRIDRCANGVLWRMDNLASSATSLKYSTDGGDTWTQFESGTGSQAMIYIDENDYMHVVWRGNDTTGDDLYYKRGIPQTGRTSWIWDATKTVQVGDASDAYWEPNVRAFWASDTGSNIVMVVWSYYTPSTAYTYRSLITITSGGTYTVGARVTIKSGNATTVTRPAIEIDHTLDGKTPLSTPHFYILHNHNGATPTLSVQRYVYSGSDAVTSEGTQFHTSVYSMAGAVLGNCFYNLHYDAATDTLFYGGRMYASALGEQAFFMQKIAGCSDASPVWGSKTNTSVFSQGISAFASSDWDIQGGSTLFGADGNAYFIGRAIINSTECIATFPLRLSDGSYGAARSLVSQTQDTPYVSSHTAPFGDNLYYLFYDGSALNLRTLVQVSGPAVFDGTSFSSGGISTYNGTAWVSGATQSL